MTPEHRHPRRRDRSKDEGWIRDLLHRGEAAVLSAVLDGKPFALPRVYVYDEDRSAIYVHGAFGGVTGKVMAQSGGVTGEGTGAAAGKGTGAAAGEGTGGVTGAAARAGSGAGSGASTGVPMTITIFEMGRLLPASEALEFGVEYASVVVTGKAVEVEDQAEVEQGLVKIMEKYAPHLKAGDDYRPIAPDEVIRTSVIRIDIEAWSGKEKTEAEDFPGAYWFKDVR